MSIYNDQLALTSIEAGMASLSPNAPVYGIAYRQIKITMLWAILS